MPLGFYLKLYRGPGAHWVNDSFDGALYVAFWCLVVFLLRPRWRPRWIAAGALAGTCMLEFLQLWHPRFLEIVRSYFIGAAILGDTFAWSDFPYYFLGAGLGWMWLARLNSRRRRYDRVE